MSEAQIQQEAMASVKKEKADEGVRVPMDMRLRNKLSQMIYGDKSDTSEETKKQEKSTAIDQPKEFTVQKLNEGTGPVVPRGARVSVHYTGKLTDGTVFDSSWQRGKPLVFKVGEGAVIKGWDEGITQLKRGEKAIITCPPDYAYGASGKGPIPRNATLTFEVEVIDF